MQTSVNLYSYNYSEARTYLASLLFVAGNMALPQIFHLMPQGGLIWLPIYFFTLIGAYKYGWKVGLLTAIASPIINSALFGMPLPAALPAILTKSTLLALGAGIAAQHFKKVSILLLLGVVAFYQILGSLAEWAYIGSLTSALQDLRIGIPGILMQIIGGYLFIKHILYR